MQNRDFGALEMLFSSTRTNIPGQKFIWMGEKKYTKYYLDFGWYGHVLPEVA